MTTQQLIKGSTFLETVCRAIEIDFQSTRRIVLDIPFDDLVMIYVEMVGDERLLQISQSLDGIEKKIIKVNDVEEVSG